MTQVRPRYVPVPYQDSVEAGRLILRDGTTATVRPAHPADCEAMTRFFASLSRSSQRNRFFSASQPGRKTIESFCDDSDPHRGLSLIVTRSSGNHPRIIAVGNYVARGEESAEMAMAVSDKFQGKGLGSLLLERLALLAVANGLRRFWAVTMAENQRMLEIFRNSGFECRTRSDSGYVEIDLSVTPTEASVARAEIRDRVATAASVRPFFHPHAVAVIGASRNPASIGQRVLQAIVGAGFRGPVYPINPSADSIAALTAYPSVSATPQAPDLAVITVPRDKVLDVIDDCAARGVKAVVVITAGFAETGTEGRELQQKLVEKVRSHGMRMVGPNCLGLLNADPAVKLNASFSPVFPLPGHIALSSQSGALGLAILCLSRERELGVSHFVSVGNKADVSGNDLMQYWEEDNQVEIILFYLESFGNPRRFTRIARRVGRRKPIIAVKAGRTGAGRRAAGSHTAALAASEVAVDALFLQSGVIRAESLDEMFDLATGLSNQPLPKGRRVGIITNAGGLGILCADACEAGGLSVPELNAKTKKLLQQFLPESASVANPVDMIASASAEQFRQAVEVLLAADELDAVIVLYMDVALTDPKAVADGVTGGIAAARQRGASVKPVYACVMAPGAPAKPLIGNGEHVPNFAFPETPARTLGKLVRYAEWRSKPAGMVPDFDDIQPSAARSVCQKVLRERRSGWLSSEEIHGVFGAFSLPMPSGGVSRTADEAVATARGIGFPVAVKLASNRIVHKTEIGGVQLNLEDEDAVRRAFVAIQERLAKENKLDQMDGVLVQPMLTGGVELMVGVTQDPSFGPLIAFGLGGVHVEILRDVSFRVTPITDQDAKEMIRGIRGYRLLQGYRGAPAADISAVENLLLRVARLVEEVPEISELDLNPVFAFPPGRGCLIVDARVRVDAIPKT